MKKTARIMILLSILSLPLFATTSHAKTTERDLKKMVVGLNKNLNKTPNPNSGMRMDNVTAGPGLLITYHATLTQQTAADLKLNEFYAYMRNDLLGKLCNNPDVKGQFQDNVTFRYIYKGYDGSNIANISIGRKDCGF
jgi:hypothetical protein